MLTLGPLDLLRIFIPPPPPPRQRRAQFLHFFLFLDWPNRLFPRVLQAIRRFVTRGNTFPLLLFRLQRRIFPYVEIREPWMLDKLVFVFLFDQDSASRSIDHFLLFLMLRKDFWRQFSQNFSKWRFTIDCEEIADQIVDSIKKMTISNFTKWKRRGNHGLSLNSKKQQFFARSNLGDGVSCGIFKGLDGEDFEEESRMPIHHRLTENLEMEKSSRHRSTPNSRHPTWSSGICGRWARKGKALARTNKVNVPL